jgi:sec-independent protein translocase protein TatA
MIFGWLEITVILVIIFIIFGVGRSPQVSDTIGRGLRSLRGHKVDSTESKESTHNEIKVIRKLEDEETPDKSK